MSDKIKSILNTVLIIGISSAISVYASNMNSNTIDYCKDGNENPVTVREALDTLYASVDVTTITPVGSILPYMGTTAPENYLICDGSVYNIAAYKKLADHIKKNFGSYNFFGGNGTTTFAVPDLRGEFLRGAGTNGHSGEGDGAAVGGHQDATRIPTVTNNTSNNYLSISSAGEGSSMQNVDAKAGSRKGSKVAGSATSSNYYSLVATRPTNTSVNYIIKVK